MSLFSKKTIKILLVQIILFIILGEIATRVFYPLPEFQKEKTIHYGTAAVDEYFGWFPKSNYALNDSILDAAGQYYPIHYTSEENGFRKFGNLGQDSLPKILFIGDSFTQSAEVSDGKTFYEIFQDSFPSEIFAFGCSGYGTLQEFLVFEKYYEQIQPDLIIWQMCSNDFIDNHIKLENACLYKNQKRRPYLVNSKIEYHSSERKVYNYLLQHSALFFNIDLLIRKVNNKYNLAPPGEILIGEKGKDYKKFKAAFDITDEILKRIKSTIEGKSKLVMFCSDYAQPQLSFLREVATNNEIAFVEDNVHRLNEAKGANEVVFCYDNIHWNERGHQIVANALLTALKRDQIID